MHEPFVSIIVLNWNNSRDTIQCLQSLLSLSYSNSQVIVCDNNSSDDSVAQISEWCRLSHVDYQVIEESQLTSKLNQKVLIVKNDQNYGYAGGNNIGLRYAAEVAQSDFAWILNNDVVVDKDSLSKLVLRASEDEKLALIGSTILDYGSTDTIQTQAGGQYHPILGIGNNIGGGLKLSQMLDLKEVERRTNYITGASVLVRLAAMKHVGMMDESYFLYYEELDWAIRTVKAGFRLGYAPRSIIWHKEGATIGSSSKSKKKNLIADYYGLKNRLRVTKKFFPAALPTVWLGLLGAMLKRLLTGQFKRASLVLGIMFGLDRRPALVSTM